MIRRPPRSTLDRSSAASDVYKRQVSNRLSQYEWPSDDVLDVTASWRGTKELCATASAARCDKYPRPNARSLSSFAASKISNPTFQEWQCRPTGAYFLAMLVSAAIEPYRKSYGNSLSSAATAGGSKLMDRMTASPRKTCVPGVHACATAGATISASTANTAPRATQPTPNRVRRVTLRPAARLHPMTFPLATDGPPGHF